MNRKPNKILPSGKISCRFNTTYKPRKITAFVYYATCNIFSHIKNSYKTRILVNKILHVFENFI